MSLDLASEYLPGSTRQRLELMHRADSLPSDSHLSH